MAAFGWHARDGHKRSRNRRRAVNCGGGLKYPLPKIEKKLDRLKPIDYAAL